jgi:hypothetical protein
VKSKKVENLVHEKNAIFFEKLVINQYKTDIQQKVYTRKIWHKYQPEEIARGSLLDSFWFSRLEC